MYILLDIISNLEMIESIQEDVVCWLYANNTQFYINNLKSFTSHMFDEVLVFEMLKSLKTQ
jgi:hypothetical protein